ncbi:hypothetical protein CFK38_04340 [Brachybacterium vulturis]|uniref:Uncharacterized protein n=1 Tax=Brachybacterium vulturis TaxID=2017484 RepID=A0A291GKX5_9MICO|nr:hypothetical protein [Brachybacterium vulturis]ATG50838.1 hypothetical protein CFK38_04340 [Brachybacterium vulturis]
MDVSACLEPFSDVGSPDRYLVRVWVQVERPHEQWRTSDWWLTEADSVAEVIGWAREHAGGDPSEVFAETPDGTLLLLWGAAPEDASRTVTVTLWNDEDRDVPRA